jgi:hypothetical protein
VVKIAIKQKARTLLNPRAICRLIPTSDSRTLDLPWGRSTDRHQNCIRNANEHLRFGFFDALSASERRKTTSHHFCIVRLPCSLRFLQTFCTLPFTNPHQAHNCLAAVLAQPTVRQRILPLSQFALHCEVARQYRSGFHFFLLRFCSMRTVVKVLGTPCSKTFMFVQVSLETTMEKHVVFQLCRRSGQLRVLNGMKQLDNRGGLPRSVTTVARLTRCRHCDWT